MADYSLLNLYWMNEVRAMRKRYVVRGVV